MRVVIGTGPGALRSAAARAVAGEPVLLLQESDNPYGRTAPWLPEGTGRMYVSEDLRDAVEAVTGPLVEAPDVTRAVLARGKIRWLPLSKVGVTQLFERYAMPEVGRRWLERRLRNAMTPLTGEGREERSYRDWVVRRMGEPLFHHLYAEYARARFGADPEDLSCTVARVVHGDALALQRSVQVAGGGPEQSLEFTKSVIESAGGEVRTGVKVRGLAVEDGRVCSVQTEDGDISLEGPLWIARPPARIASWLGDALGATLQHDAQQLRTADAVQVGLRGGPVDLPDEIHVVGESASFYRVVTTYGGERSVVFHATVPTGEALSEGLPARVVADATKMGLRGFEEAGAVVERLPDHVPIWTARCHARLRRLTLAWQELGIVAVGRQGTFSPMDIGQEVAWAQAMNGSDTPDQREALRALLEPPANPSNLWASAAQFVVS